MLEIRYTAQFRRDYKALRKRGYNPRLLQDALEILSQGLPLPPQYRDHKLTGNLGGHRECHIAPDWLLIYKADQARLLLTLTRTGTHSDLLGL